jgi:hypothetical protein
MKKCLFISLFLVWGTVLYSQDSSLVTWSAKKKGKSPTDISFVITADIKKGHFIHPCEDCSFNDWDDLDPRTEIDFTVDSNWTVKPVFSKNKYKQKTDFLKGKREGKEMVIKKGDTTYKPTSTPTYQVDCRVFNRMKLFRGIELVPSERIIKRYNALLALKEDETDKDKKKREKLMKEAPETLAYVLTPPDHFVITITFNVNKGNRQQIVLFVPNTYRTPKEWGWKKTPRKIVNKEQEEPHSKTELK